MKGAIFSVLCLLGLNLVSCYPYAQQQGLSVPPHLLRAYLTQKQQSGRQEAAPIYEQDTQLNAAPQYVAREQSQPQYITQYVQQPAQPQYVQQVQPQYVPQSQPQYIARPQQAKRPKPKPQQVQQALDEEEEAYDDPNASYQFGFDVNDDQFTNYQNRKEERQGGVIKGSYSVVDSDGFIRTVTYTADPKEGFKAEVVRKPTDIVVKIPTPQPQTLEQTRPRQQYQLEESPQPQRYIRPQPKPQPQQYYQYQ